MVKTTRRRGRKALQQGLALLLVVSACSEAPALSGSSPHQAATEAPNCSAPSEGQPWVEAATAKLQLIDEVDGLSVYAAEYPLPGPTDGLWSQWGQGVVANDGRHYSAVGDHLGPDGNSHFFVYEPQSRTVTRFMDVLSVIERPAGSWGFGKIHAQMVVDRCDRIWAATYWGTRRGIDDYDGDHLMVIDPDRGIVSDVGVLAAGRGIPSMTITASDVIVAEAVDPVSDKGILVAFDAIEMNKMSELEDDAQIGFRALGLEGSGAVTYSRGGGSLGVWNPVSGETSTLTEDLPGEWMRATTQPEDGVSYGVTRRDSRLYRLMGGSIEDLGDPGGYTTSVARDQQADAIYWMADAHGGAWEAGAPIMTLDTATGEATVLVELREAFESELGLLPGGTYSMVYSNGALILGVNASTDDSGFGAVVLVVVEGL